MEFEEENSEILAELLSGDSVTDATWHSIRIIFYGSKAVL
jgi:hypothetical protein